MIAIAVQSKKALREKIGTNINHLVIETSLFSYEYSDNCSLPFVYPSPYKRKGFGQITVIDGMLSKVK